tara:strand:- start:107 stop:256 length:150 start_codon:yes stop_codon:yes gene_type:complete
MVGSGGGFLKIGSAGVAADPFHEVGIRSASEIAFENMDHLGLAESVSSY